MSYWEFKWHFQGDTARQWENRQSNVGSLLQSLNFYCPLPLRQVRCPLARTGRSRVENPRLTYILDIGQNNSSKIMWAKGELELTFVKCLPVLTFVLCFREASTRLRCHDKEKSLGRVMHVYLRYPRHVPHSHPPPLSWTCTTASYLHMAHGIQGDAMILYSPNRILSKQGGRKRMKKERFPLK